MSLFEAMYQLSRAPDHVQGLAWAVFILGLWGLAAALGLAAGQRRR